MQTYISAEKTQSDVFSEELKSILYSENLKLLAYQKLQTQSYYFYCYIMKIFTFVFLW